MRQRKEARAVSSYIHGNWIDNDYRKKIIRIHIFNGASSVLPIFIIAAVTHVITQGLTGMLIIGLSWLYRCEGRTNVYIRHAHAKTFAALTYSKSTT